MYNLKLERYTVKPFTKGSKVEFLGHDYIIDLITETDVRLRRVGSASRESHVIMKIGSKRFNKIFLGNYEGAFQKIKEAEEMLDVDIEYITTEEPTIVEFQDIVDSLRVSTGSFNSKTEATVWCLEALTGDGENISSKYINPLYTILALYYHKTELTEVTEEAVEEYISTSSFRDKFTNYYKFVELVLNGCSDVVELMTYIPDDYEDIILEFLLGRVQLNVTLKDLKHILLTVERKNVMAKKDDLLANLSDEALLETYNFLGSVVAARGLEGESSEEGADVDLAELIEDMDATEVLALVKEAGVTIRATAKTKGLSAEDLAALIEEKLDEEQMETLLELLDDAGDADDDEDEEEDDDEDEDGAEDDEDDDDDEDESELAELLEEALEEESIAEILENAEVEVKLTAKQKKMDAEELAEVLESKLDADDMDTLLEYLAGDEDDEEEDEDEDDEDEDGAELSELLEEALEDETIAEILDGAEVEVKLTAKQKKMDAEELAEVLESKLDEDDLETLIDYLSGEADDEDGDDEDSDDEDEDDINIDDLDDEEVLSLADEEEIKYKKVKGKVSAAEMKKVRKALKEIYE